MSRALNISLGRDGPIQRFSLAKQPDPLISDEVLRTLRSTTHARVKAQTLSDPTKCSQFAMAWGDTVGFLTRPVIIDNPPAAPSVLASWSDHIGTCVPVMITLDDFQGSFTSLAPRRVVMAYHLPHHPQDPATFRGPPPPAPGPPTGADAADAGADAPGADANAADLPEPVEGTLARLGFPMPAHPADGDFPLLTVFPNVFPLAVGHTIPDGVSLNNPASYANADPCLKAWCDALHYIQDRNNGHSATVGGSLFHQPDVALPPADDPFTTMNVRPKVAQDPILVPPTLDKYRETMLRFNLLFDETWATLGASLPRPAPTLPNTPTQGMNADQIRAIVSPIVDAGNRKVSPKEQEQKDSAQDVMLAYRIAFSTIPIGGEDDPTQRHLVIPDLHPRFVEILNKTKPVLATQALSEHIRGRIELALASDKAIDCDVTIDADQITTAFANSIRSNHWLTEPLNRTPKHIAQQKLGVLHFLTPVRGLLLAHRETEAANGPMILSHVSDDRAQLEASKSSALYSGGRLEHGNDIYFAICNLRLLILSMLADNARTPLLLEKLRIYALVIKSLDGRLFFDQHRLTLMIIVHLFQDIQHILGMFMAVAKRTALKEALRDGQPIDVKIFWNCTRTADSLTDRLRQAITGNGLGDFKHAPLCLDWFPKLPAIGQSTPQKQQSPAPSQQPNRTPPSRPTPGTAVAPKKPRLQDKDDIERKKTLGLLAFDKKVANSNRLPHCPIYAKPSASAAKERLCMQFMTLDHYCSRTPCPYPHIASIARLPKEDNDAFCAWVKKTPGLAFAPGKGPAGTP